MNSSIFSTVTWTIIGYLAGSMMFSYWLGKFTLQVDIRHYGDGNPGSTNVWKAGGWKKGVLGGILDFSKGLVPVAVAHWVFDFKDWALVPIALAPILGHAFSPFLRFKGGKAVAVTLGVWTAIAAWEGLFVLGIFMGIFFALQKVDSWAIILGMIAFIVYLYFRDKTIYPLCVGLGNLVILIYKHRVDLRKPIKPRFSVFKDFRRIS